MIDPDVLLLTYSETGEILGYSRQTIRRYIAEGRLHAVGRGPGRRVTRQSVERYCETLGLKEARK